MDLGIGWWTCDGRAEQRERGHAIFHPYCLFLIYHIHLGLGLETGIDTQVVMLCGRRGAADAEGHGVRARGRGEAASGDAGGLRPDHLADGGKLLRVVRLEQEGKVEDESDEWSPSNSERSCGT